MEEHGLALRVLALECDFLKLDVVLAEGALVSLEARTDPPSGYFRG